MPTTGPEEPYVAETSLENIFDDDDDDAEEEMMLLDTDNPVKAEYSTSFKLTLIPGNPSP
jgi:hypothetical protein